MSKPNSYQTADGPLRFGWLRLKTESASIDVPLDEHGKVAGCCYPTASADPIKDLTPIEITAFTNSGQQVAVGGHNAI